MSGHEQICIKDVIILYYLANGVEIDFAKVFSVHNWALKEKQPKGPPFINHMLSICNTYVLVESKAPKTSSKAEKRVSQGKNPGVQTRLRRKSSKHTLESKPEGNKGGSSTSPTGFKTGHLDQGTHKAFSCNTLADLGASINLMPYSLYAKLSLESLKPTKMIIRLTDRSFQHPIGIAENMLVKVGKFTFPEDFVILEMEEDSNVCNNRSEPPSTSTTPPLYPDLHHLLHATTTAATPPHCHPAATKTIVTAGTTTLYPSTSRHHHHLQTITIVILLPLHPPHHTSIITISTRPPYHLATTVTSAATPQQPTPPSSSAAMAAPHLQPHHRCTPRPPPPPPSHQQGAF
nr:reverse transcriptase domain-containing protein [Tanacetum cinerariifolium]